MKELIEPLLDMSNGGDVVSQGIAGLLTEMSVQYPFMLIIDYCLIATVCYCLTH
jgi:hypothetical protein